ncbi:hypothetical protein MMAG44476_14295 [Mycolicibacterium mageritense DSM 44476 = CIP 104973]|uniref:Uncharacterized protein n=1 Tax=Mycolicibacterium mageritense TaxID=53462 RepID=A0ABM7HST5_MYCME|nr:hypothetical protein [Mycolicibacterium mageritense]BBX33627.1 hypothetical protein MMAGJ_29090 [Mycolicibacterium mageritense]CDO22055.1 hypothetical protein BN978_02520 [Mycolicibacterium mageritense DSM 44476 = CIP 104973]
MTIEYTQPRSPKASRPSTVKWAAALLVIGFAAAVVSLLAVAAAPSADVLNTIARGCSTESQALSNAEKEYGAKSSRANAVRSDYNDCIVAWEAATKQSMSPLHRGIANNGAGITALALGIGAVLWLSAGSRVTDLGERVRVHSRALRGLPPKEPTIRIAQPAAPVEPSPEPAPEAFQQTFPLSEPVVDYPEDTDAEPVVDEPQRARSGWGTASKHKLTFGDGDVDG